jgi:lipopolysaccharide export system protein LptA
VARPTRIPGLAAFVALSLASGALVAEGEPPRDAPVPAQPRAAAPQAAGLEMTAEQLDIDIEAKTAVFRGRVRLAKGSMTLSCPRVDVRYDDVPNVKWVKGSGGVSAEVKGVKAEAPEVELHVASQVLELRGGVRLTRGAGWMTAERATIHVASGKLTMTDVKGVLPLEEAAGIAKTAPSRKP